MFSLLLVIHVRSEINNTIGKATSILLTDIHKLKDRLMTLELTQQHCIWSQHAQSLMYMYILVI